ncbi:MAG TPA: PQQ-binding-like beta-propeller repeat protein [Planctomycetota bacterium]|nr:PQQ-binding-like beta-propeller repeat protein [Planctomycetota bacterium]
MMKRITFGLVGLLWCSSVLRADDWPQWGGPQRDLVWREKGIVKTLPPGDLLPRMWSTPVGEGYSGPAVAEGRVFITDLVDRKNKSATERVLALEASTGKVLWTVSYPVEYGISYPAGPRATPVVDGDRVYSAGAVGDLLCLEVASGKVVWKKSLTSEYGANLPTWGLSASPLVDGNQLIVLVGGLHGALVVSFEKTTGKELWKAIDDPEVGYVPPVIFTFGGVRQLIQWHPRAVTSLDPSTGQPLWEVPFKAKVGLVISTPRQVGSRLFVTAFYNGPMMLEVSADGRSASVVWRGKSDSELKTDGLHSIMSTPWMTESHIYGVCSYGQLRCLDAKTGERIWETRKPTGDGRWWNAFIVPHEDRYFLHNEQGDLIIATMSPEGYTELSRSRLVEPTRKVNNRMTIWSHPAFAMKSVFARNDQEIVRVDLAEK